MKYFDTHSIEQLMRSVPKEKRLTASSYERAKHISEDWYKTLLCLNGKLGDSYKRSNDHNFEFNIDLKDLTELWIDQRGQCAVSGLPMSIEKGTVTDRNMMGVSIDRIDSSEGYVIDNIRLLIFWINNAKHTYSDDTLYLIMEHTLIHRGMNLPTTTQSARAKKDLLGFTRFA
jgi:hypothetical protein